ncbi:lytic murein transglycosylase, partial [Nocardia sp. NPDC049190]|uniref:lytic transglycosylase domain-containing protein n=1 Tax=Nocardia sp. NPDC049190 TaxID=3155650 RepID=UPI0033EE86F7
MRISAPMTVSALVVAGVVMSGSAVDPSAAVRAREGLSVGAGGVVGLSRVVGLLPVVEGPRRFRAFVPWGVGRGLREVPLPAVGGGLGIPEVVLAAYRNAELALASSMPGCGVSWNLLAGIGRIESGHAGGGRTDSAGTTLGRIEGPVLDGRSPGDEVVRDGHGGFARAVGPMQFLPETWNSFGADGNGDGVADPNNVFDAALGAGKYLCSGGLDLRDPGQELRAVLRYNNSLSYAANVLSWSAAYRGGGSSTRVPVVPRWVPPGGLPGGGLPGGRSDRGAIVPVVPGVDPVLPPYSLPVVPLAPAPVEVMISVPGLPPIPCGVFCPAPVPVAPPADPCLMRAVPAPMPRS